MSIAILLIAYNRLDLVKQRLLELASSDLAPQNVILSVDGSKDLAATNFKNEYIALVRDLNLSFHCEMVFRESNLGCSKHIITAVTEVLDEYENVVVIEDDVSIASCFLRSMSDAINMTTKCEDIGTIGGFSNFHKNVHFPFFFKKNYWRKTKYFSAWGWSTSREFWKHFKSVNEIADLEDFLSTSVFWRNISTRKKRVWLARFRRGVWDFNVQLILFKANQWNLLPALRIIDNQGFSDSRSTHTKHKRPWNLFGVGLSNTSPSRIKLFKYSNPTNLFWNFVDSNLWAADGLLNARAREKGVRTIIRSILRLPKFNS